MNLQSAFNRIAWRFRVQNGKHVNFMPNQADLNAMNTIAEWINREKEERINQNRHFGKITVHFYVALMRRYNNDNALCEKMIQEVLEQPLINQYQWFLMQMNLKEFNQMCYFLGVEDTHCSNNAILNADITAGEKLQRIKANSQKNADLLSDKQNQQMFLKSVNPWQLPQITSKLNHFLSELLNKYGNLE